MKIRTKIALRYTGVIAAVIIMFVVFNYIIHAQVREKEFYRDLKKEGVTKANLYFEAKATPEIMHTIYKNNIKYIDEVEVAIYDKNLNELYRDTQDNDFMHETPQQIKEIWDTKKDLKIHEGKYQTIGFIFNHNNTDYIVMAASRDGYGYSTLEKLIIYLLILGAIALLGSLILGYYLAKSVLKPVSEISDKMKDITANNLHLRLLKYNENDEFGELATSFNKTLDIIESSFESQKMFVSNVSHELRTPLATLIGEVDLALLKDRSIEEYKAALISSRQDTNKLIILLNGLLDLAKASYDENKISMTTIRIDEVLLDARELVLKGNSDYNVELLFNQQIEDDSEITIRGNEYLLKIAFTNLIENNCKYSDNKTSIVKISSYDNRIMIQFSDTGIGIPEDEIKHLFTPFYRGSNKGYSQGNGIGLALAKKVINTHKGDLTVDSNLGEGTVFTVKWDKCNNNTTNP